MNVHSVYVMHESVEDRICKGGVPYGLAPQFKWQLASDHSGFVVVAIVKDLKQVAMVRALERSDQPIAQDNEISDFP